MSCDTAHGLNTLAGHIVRQTFPGEPGREHVDVAEYADDEYAQAIAHAKRVRLSAPGVYAVVDPVYSCGCRGQG